MFCKFTQNATNPSTNNHYHQHQQFFSIIQKKTYMFMGKRVNYSQDVEQPRHRRLIMLVFVTPANVFLVFLLLY